MSEEHGGGVGEEEHKATTSGFLVHSDLIDSGATAMFQRYEGEGDGEVAAKMGYVFLLAEATRPGNHHYDPKGYASSSYSTSESTLSYVPPLPLSSSASSFLSYSSMYTTRPNTPSTMTTTTTTTTNLRVPATFMTYHLHLAQSHFNVLIGQLMLGNFTCSSLPSYGLRYWWTAWRGIPSFCHQG